MFIARLVLLTILFGLVTGQSASSTSPAAKPISTDTRCGSQYGGTTCAGSAGGDCCSIFAYCGSSSDYCSSQRCQPDYGNCRDTTPASASTLISMTRSGSWAVCPASTVTSTVAQGVSTRTLTSISTSTSTTTSTSTSTSTSVSTSVSTATSVSTSTAFATITTTSTATPPPATSAMTVTVAGTPITITTTLTPSTVTLSVTATASLAAAAGPSTVVTQSYTTTVTTTTTTTTTQSPPSGAIPATITITTTASTILTTNPALLNLGAPATTILTTTTTTVTSTYVCPTNQPVGNPSFEPNNLSPWIALSAGIVSSGRTTGGSSLSAYAYKFTLDAANPNLPQRLLQPVALCPGATYALSFNARQSLATGSVSIIGSVQVVGGNQVQMAGGTVTGSTFYAAAGSIANLAVGSGAGPVAAVLIIEATFGPAGTLGAKEAYIDEIYLNKV
ncbi:hypothetical protein ACEQ8H_003707 [Pleosporales sp. CAS-2024a]